jgi:hypothetical protein
VTPSAPDLPRTVQAPEAPPVFGQEAGPRKPKKKPQPTALGEAATAGLGQLGQKTLLGQ